jgi:ADP-heptose:LPS heptosyltransferase
VIVSRFLLVRLGALGDIVHTMPLAAALREAFPTARIDWLVEAKHRAVLDCVPILSNRIIVDSRRARGETSPLRVIRRLREARYDVAFDAQGLIKSAVYARLSGAARVVGFTRAQLREPAARFFYTGTIDPYAVLQAAAPSWHGGAGASRSGGTIAPDGVDDARSRDVSRDAGVDRHGVHTRGQAGGARGLDASLHIIARTRALAAAVGVDPSGPWRFPLDTGESAAPAEVRATLGLALDEPFVLLNPGAAWPNKRWPADRFGGLARRIHERAGLRSAVLWGPGEADLAAQVAAASDGAAAPAPPTRIADILALASVAALLVSGDTGPIHLGAAVGTPIVGIYGPTDPARNGPWDPRDEVVSRVALCACHHQRRCHAAAWCLADVPVDEVWRAVARRMGWTA